MKDNYPDSLSLNIKEHLLNGSRTSAAVLTKRHGSSAQEVCNSVEETLRGTEEQGRQRPLRSSLRTAVHLFPFFTIIAYSFHYL